MVLDLLPLPAFYKPENAFVPGYNRAIAWPTEYPVFPRFLDVALQYREEHRVPTVKPTEPNILSLDVDWNKDFTEERGSLSVPGALHDAVRMVTWKYRHSRFITKVRRTADQHDSCMITHPYFLRYRDGSHPKPFDVHTESDFATGRVGVNPDIAPFLPGNFTVEWLNKFFAYYCHMLEELGRPPLVTWPEHCIDGSYGQTQLGIFDEWVQFHQFVRGTYNKIYNKGQSPFLECFSAVGPDILTAWDGTPIPLARINVELLDEVDSADVTIGDGQAASHCVPATFLRIVQHNPAVAERIYLFEDGMSPVPGFEAQALAARKELERAGVHFVTTDMPIETWPGIMPRLIERFN